MASGLSLHRAYMGVSPGSAASVIVYDLSGVPPGALQGWGWGESEVRFLT